MQFLENCRFRTAHKGACLRAHFLPSREARALRAGPECDSRPATVTALLWNDARVLDNATPFGYLGADEFPEFVRRGKTQEGSFLKVTAVTGKDAVANRSV